MALIGYARVSTEDQATFSQLDELKAAGCTTIFEEKASGASRARPELAKAVAQVRRGDILVVARIDRLARSLSHLLDVIEGLETRGAHFKSLRDPIDTSPRRASSPSRSSAPRPNWSARSSASAPRRGCGRPRRAAG